MGKQAAGKTMLHLHVSSKLDQKIAELADRTGISKAALGAMLLEAAVEDNEFFIRAVSHPLIRRVIHAVRGKEPSKIEINAQ